MSLKNIKERINSFEECVDEGNPVMESYPRKCRSGDQVFVEDIGNELEKTDMIRVSNPRPNQDISSPLRITGEARGTWFFEADFPVYLYDSNGNKISEAIATANGDWMREEFVEFEAELIFVGDYKGTKGIISFVKDNPSGIEGYNDSLDFPVYLK